MADRPRSTANKPSPDATCALRPSPASPTPPPSACPRRPPDPSPSEGRCSYRMPVFLRHKAGHDRRRPSPASGRSRRAPSPPRRPTSRRSGPRATTPPGSASRPSRIPAGARNGSAGSPRPGTGICADFCISGRWRRSARAAGAGPDPTGSGRSCRESPPRSSRSLSRTGWPGWSGL